MLLTLLAETFESFSIFLFQNVLDHAGKGAFPLATNAQLVSLADFSVTFLLATKRINQ